MEDDGGGRSRECDAPGGHFVEDSAEAEKIGARVELFAAGLFGGHVRNGPHGHTRAGERLLGSYSLKRSNGGCGHVAFGGQLRQTEIQQFGLAAVSDQNVSGLNVTVDDAFLVGGVEGVGDLDADVEESVERKVAACDAILERFAFEQLHYKK